MSNDTKYGFHIAVKAAVCRAADYTALVTSKVPLTPGTLIIDPDVNTVIGVIDYAGNLQPFGMVWPPGTEGQVLTAHGPGVDPTFVTQIALPKSDLTNGALRAQDTGHMVAAIGNITVNDAIFSTGDAVSIKNTTAGDISIVQGSGVTLQLAGTATTGTRTLAQKGIMTIWFETASIGSCIGQGLT